MAMNNVYYRFRHMAGEPIYREKPTGLRMNRLMQPATNRLRAATVYAAAVALGAGETPQTESPAVGASVQGA
jgi:lipoyl-dependent peroxiredoxin subunit D